MKCGGYAFTTYRRAFCSEQASNQSDQPPRHQQGGQGKTEGRKRRGRNETNRNETKRGGNVRSVKYGIEEGVRLTGSVSVGASGGECVDESEEHSYRTTEDACWLMMLFVADTVECCGGRSPVRSSASLDKMAGLSICVRRRGDARGCEQGGTVEHGRERERELENGCLNEGLC
ncbi:unnamed protein product [Calypogeia fissa]